MKKLFCMVLALGMCLACLAACNGTEEQVTKTPSQSSDTEIEVQEDGEEISVDITEFSGTALTSLKGVNITVAVCEEYVDALGETVNIVLPDLIDLAVGIGDMVQVKIDRVVNTTPLTVYAADFDAWMEEKDPDANVIPDMTEYDIMQYVPDDIHDESIEYEAFSSGRNLMMYVYSIGEDAVYLAYPRAAEGWAYIVSMDTADLSFQAGDFVNLKIKQWYSPQPSQNFTVGYEEDLEELSLCSREDVIAYFKQPVFAKPVIYLYPEADTECSVKVTLSNGELTCTYPEHGTNGWQNFIARPDGTLMFPDGSEYYCLYWEGKASFEPDFTKGFCVKGSDTAQFLESVLPEMGLSAREANEFIIYWLPILQENPYNLISFQTDAYTSVAKLEITPTPDSLLRVYMTAKPMESYVEIEGQTFDGFERVGFAVVEWGGSIIE